MNKRTFDLIIAVDVGFLILWGGAGIWSRQRLANGPSTGVAHAIAKIAKAVTP